MLIDAIKKNFEGYEDLREFLLSQPKFGNKIPLVDDEAVDGYEPVEWIASGVKAINKEMKSPKEGVSKVLNH